ncbi:MAG: phosphoglycerate dehydrogenase [Candidatus Limnocylindrales bacterium]|jgi:D-3-phosphoglycerate dehydrogenase
MKILVAEQLARQGLEILRAHHEVDEKLGLTPEELNAIIGEYDALLVRSQVKVTAEILAHASRLIVIGRAGVGVDNVDLEAATRAGVVVVNAPTGNTVSAAEQTIALMLALARKTAAADASMRKGEWKRSAFTGVELRGRTLGIIGLGKIGQAVADRARGLEMNIIGFDPFVTADQAALHGIALVDMDTIIEKADVITVHVPLNKATRGIIGSDQVARLKPGVMLVNAARGGVYDEAAVAQGLADGKIAGAAFDVFETEPPVDSPLLTAPNTVLTPHLGASTAEAQVRVAEEACEQVIDVLAGRSARYAVNAPLLTPETARAIAPYLPLTETLGRIAAQYFRGAVKTLTVDVAGDLANYDASQLTAAALRGVLENATTERVNLINAGFLAKNRGLTVNERKTSDAGTFASLVTLTLEGDTGKAVVAGTIANGEPRLTRIDDNWLDMAPTPLMVVTRHQDKPGTMGRIGLMLGEADVNISAMHLARTAPRQDALMLLAVDDEVPDAVAEAIRNHPAVLDVWVIRAATDR